MTTIKYDLSQLTNLQIGYIAGVIDVGGYFSIKAHMLKGRLNYQTGLSLFSTSYEFFEHLKELMKTNCRIRVNKKKMEDPNKIPCFFMTLTGQLLTDVCLLIETYCVNKKPQVELMNAMRETYETDILSGTPTPPEIIELRNDIISKMIELNMNKSNRVRSNQLKSKAALQMKTAG